MSCGEATLFRRRVRIVELNASELRRADDWARRIRELALSRDARETSVDSNKQAPLEGDAALAVHVAGAQGELAVAKVLGVDAPLRVLPNTARGGGYHDQPDIPPCWSVKTQLSQSKDMLDRYLRLRARDLHLGWRHVLVERDTGLWGGFVFTVHGWIADERAREVAVQRYAYSTNQFVHLKHLSPLTRDVYDTVYGAPTDQPPAPAPFDTDQDAR